MKKERMNVRSVIGTLMLAAFTSLPCLMSAQESNRTARHELPNPEKSAQRITDQMKQELNLTDKQYKKVYKLNLQEQEEMVEQFSNRQDRRMPPPPMDGERPSGNRPPMGNSQGRPNTGERPGSGSEDMEKLREKKEKKLKKILTDEQYKKWTKMQQKGMQQGPQRNRDGNK